MRVFLSYRRADASEASALERQFALRGLPLWRDVNDLPLGGSTEREIRRGIATCDVFVLYVTPRVFASDVIWRLEVPAALARARREARRGRLYPIVPVLRGVTTNEFRRRCAGKGVHDFPTKNAAFVPVHGHVRATVNARRVAFAAAATRLLRSLGPALPRAAVPVVLRTFEAPEARRAALDLNWSGVLEDASPGVWATELFPALRDVARELARARRRRLQVLAKARLGVAVAFGMVFPLASGFALDVMDRQGPWPRGRARRPPLAVSRAHSGLAGRAVIEISLAQDAGRRAAALAASLRASHVRLTPPLGPGRAFDPRPVAGAIAMQVGNVVRELRAEGAQDIHLVFAGPAALALLIGRQLHATGTIHCYYRDAKRGLSEAYTVAS